MKPLKMGVVNFVKLTIALSRGATIFVVPWLINRGPN